MNKVVELLKCEGSVLVGVEHHSDLGAEGSGREVSIEDSSDGSGVSVLLNDLAPPHSVSCVVLEGFGLVDVGDSLSKIVIGVFSLVDALDGEEVLSLVLVPLAPLESSEDALSIESAQISLSKAYLTGWVCL